MTLKPIIAALVLLTLSVGAQTLHAEDSAKKFVEDFYNWYTPIASHTYSEPASNIALRKKSALFSAELLKALKEDALASSKSRDGVVGLDSDPFVNSQDKVKEKNGAFRVDIYDVLGGQKDKKPAVIAEVKQENGHWIFVNFWNPDSGDLLSELRDLAKERKKTPK